MNPNATDVSGALAVDAAALDRLRAQAKTDSPAAIKAAAQQFEALLLNMMLKSMRDTTAQNTAFDSEQTRLFQSMLDQQFAQVLAARGIGLADIMVRQLARQAGSALPAVRGAEAGTPTAAAFDGPIPQAQEDKPAAAVAGAAAQARQFVERTWPHALEAGRLTGIPPHFILGQAALESGWGRAEIRASDGTPSYNLFGVKAGRGWSGPTVDAVTTEYLNGEPRRSVERFRAYASYGEAFRDYAQLLNGPRYAQVLERGQDAAGFAASLQQAGYASDPAYAHKLVRIINGNVLRAGLTG